MTPKRRNAKQKKVSAEQLPAVVKPEKKLSGERLPDEEVKRFETFRAKLAKAPPRFQTGEDGLELRKNNGLDSDLLERIRLAETLGTADINFSVQLVNQVAQASHGPSPSATQVNNTISAINGIAPKDELEAMLATQMVAAHNLSMEFMRRAMLPDSATEHIDRNVDRANRMMRTFTAQVEALNRYRGKGQQKVIVEHVTVEAGGQAVVGNVTSGKPGGGGRGNAA